MAVLSDAGTPARDSVRLTDPVTLRPVHTALHRPLTVCGVERRFFFLALLLGAATFNLSVSLLAGVGLFVALYALGLWATRRDPDLLRILVLAARARRRYDAAAFEPVHVEVVR